MFQYSPSILHLIRRLQILLKHAITRMASFSGNFPTTISPTHPSSLLAFSFLGLTLWRETLLGQALIEALDDVLCENPNLESEALKLILEVFDEV